MATAPLPRRNVRNIRPASLGMTWSDAQDMFLVSRRRGTDGAKTQARDKSIENYTRDLVVFTRFMVERGITHYNQMGRSDVLAFIDWVQDPKPNDFRHRAWSQATQNHVLRSIRAFFNWVDRSEDCRLEDMRGFTQCLPVIPRNVGSPSVPHKRVVKDFLNGFNTKTRVGLRDYVIGNLIVDCGLRSGECRYMRMDGLQLENRVLLVPREGKTGYRLVHISEEMVRLLRLWLRKRAKFTDPSCEWVFVADDGKFMGPNALVQSFRRHRTRTKVAGVTPHALRHYFCTDWVRQGGDLPKLQAMTGHRRLDTLEAYLHLANDESVGAEQARVSPLKGLRK